ncbi:MAG: MBL fold metallo-hydrolase, partial [Saprospiraceae bacterium]|nr:MBL fold metallo-hydrolase [Saprospiraceae bacterium]
ELKVVAFYNTHCHIDHILGNNFVSLKYDLLPIIHKAGLPFLYKSVNQALTYGFEIDEAVLPKQFIDETDTIKFGNSELKIIYSPGHADGSICIYSEAQKFIIVGDVLFYGSIGRTDLPTGNYNMLIDNIQTKLFALADDYKVYCGHGPATSIGFEKIENPYVGTSG